MDDFEGFNHDDEVLDENDIEEEEYDDEDYIVNDYENQDSDIDESAKQIEEIDNEFDDPIIEENNNDSFEDSLNTKSYSKVKNKTNYGKMTKYEFAALLAKLSSYLSDSKIDIPETMFKEKVVETANILKIALFWIRNRKVKGWEIPLKIKRQITAKVFEEIRPENLFIEEELDNEDGDDDDTLTRYYYNFRATDYED